MTHAFLKLGQSILEDTCRDYIKSWAPEVADNPACVELYQVSALFAWLFSSLCVHVFVIFGGRGISVLQWRVCRVV